MPTTSIAWSILILWDAGLRMAMFNVGVDIFETITLCSVVVSRIDNN